MSGPFNPTKFATLTNYLTYKLPNGQLSFCNKKYPKTVWDKNGLGELYEEVLSATKFLPDSTSLSVRYYFIEHNLTQVPQCAHCKYPINVPKTYSECRKNFPIVHAKCLYGYHKQTRDATNLVRYGGSPSQSQAVKLRASQTRKRLNFKEIAAKSVATRKLSTPTWGEKTRNQRTERNNRVAIDSQRGIHYKQRHIASDAISHINDPVWLSEQYLSKSAKQIALEQGVNKTIIQNRIHKFGITVIKRYSSVGEDEVCQFIRSIYQGPIERNIKILGSNFEVDIFLPELNVAVEYHGLYWHVEQQLRRKNIHLVKYKKCSAAGVQLIQIWANEWSNSPSVIKRILTQLISPSTTPTDVYECEVIELPSTDAAEFCDINHIEGSMQSNVCLGLMNNRQLMAVMTFTESDPHSTSHEWQLVRYCTSDCTTVDGAEKLLMKFKHLYQPTSIVAYSNNRFGLGTMYSSIGMNLIGESSPEYWYVNLNKADQVYSRTQVVLDDYALMATEGYDRIWDAGNRIFKWTDDSKLTSTNH